VDKKDGPRLYVFVAMYPDVIDTLDSGVASPKFLGVQNV